jgi:hypothetical protein
MSEPFWVPIREYVPGFFSSTPMEKAWLGEMNGQPAWTDGSVMLLGSPPRGFFEIAGTTIFEPVVSKADREVEKIVPVAVSDLIPSGVVIFSNGWIVKTKYYILVRRTFGTVEWLGDDQSKSDNSKPVLVKTSNGKLVALVCGMRATDWSHEIKAILQSANAGESLPTKELPEERQNKTDER